MAVKVSFANSKGGVGRTTSAQFFGDCFAKQGRKVLMVDLDSVGTLSHFFCIDPEQYEMDLEMTGQTIYQVFKGKPLREVIVNVRHNLDLVVGSHHIHRRGFEVRSTFSPEKEIQKEDYFILKKAIEEVENEYDLIVFDCPSGGGLIMDNALIASDGMIIPCQMYGGAGRILSIFKKELEQGLAMQYNPNLKIFGILMTMYNKRTLVANRSVCVVEEMAKLLSIKVFESKISETSKINEIFERKQSIFDFALSSNTARECRMFCKEFEEEYLKGIAPTQIRDEKEKSATPSERVKKTIGRPRREGFSHETSNFVRARVTPDEVWQVRLWCCEHKTTIDALIRSLLVEKNIL